MTTDTYISDEIQSLFDKVRNRHVYNCSQPGELEAPCSICGGNWRDTSNHLTLMDEKAGWSNPEFRLQRALEAIAPMLVLKGMERAKVIAADWEETFEKDNRPVEAIAAALIFRDIRTAKEGV